MLHPHISREWAWNDVKVLRPLSNRFCQSVCLSDKSFEISIFTSLKSCCTRQWHGNLKKNVCVSDGDQSSSLICISSFFLFNVGIVHHFNTVSHLDTMESGHTLTPSTCSRSPESSFPGWRKGGRGPGNEATNCAQVSEIWRVVNPRHACAAKVTVLGLCVCTLHVIIRATNDTNLLGGRWRSKF